MSTADRVAVAVFLVALALFFVGFAVWLWADARNVDRANLLRDADEQHRLCLQNDLRGIYGDYPPADLDGEPAGRWTDPTVYEWVP